MPYAAMLIQGDGAKYGTIPQVCLAIFYFFLIAVWIDW